MRPSIFAHVVWISLSGLCIGACSTSRQADPGDEADPTCSDKIRNGAETDVDCGGGECSKCVGGRKCQNDSDCRSNICNSGVCVLALAISGISPPIGPTTGGIPVTIEGDDFKEGLVVTIDGAPAEVTQLSTTEVIVNLPPRPGKAGRVDVTVTNPDQKTVTAKDGFAYYYGTTSFVEQEQRPVSYKPFSIATGDFNNDGNRDLVVANDNGQSVSVLLGRGDGTFPFPGDANKFAEYPVGNLSNCVVVADLDGDGNEDLVVTNMRGQRNAEPLDIDGDVSVLLGIGDGTFSEETIYFTGRGPSAVVVEDFNKDGIKDLAVLNINDDNVALLLGLGKGRFQSYAQQLRFPSGSSARSMAVSDFNHDGWPDLAVASLGGAVNVLVGQSGGTFPMDEPARYSVGTSASFVATGDLNSDGAIDIVTANRGADPSSAPGSVTTLLGKKDGTFPAEGSTLQAGRDPRSVALGDLNGDGYLDVAVANYGDNTVGVLIGLGDGRFLPSVDFRIEIPPGGESGPCAVAIDDLNEDGRNDLAVSNCAGNTVSILLNESH